MTERLSLFSSSSFSFSSFSSAALVSAMALVVGVAVTPAEAKSVVVRSQYQYSGSSGRWNVEFHGTVSSDGTAYRIRGYLKGKCGKSGSPGTWKWPWYGMDYAATPEKWKRIEYRCPSKVLGELKDVNVSGRLGSDRKVELEAGGWGGSVFGGKWGWGNREHAVV